MELKLTVVPAGRVRVEVPPGSVFVSVVVAPPTVEITVLYIVEVPPGAVCRIISSRSSHLCLDKERGEGLKDLPL